MAAALPPAVPRAPQGEDRNQHSDMNLEPYSEECFNRILGDAILLVKSDVASLKMMYEVPWTFLAEWEVGKKPWRTLIPDYLTVHVLCVDLIGGAHRAHYQKLEKVPNYKKTFDKIHLSKIKALDSSLKKSLKIIWPSMKCHANDDPFWFWAQEYTKHGMLSGLTVEQYMNVIWLLYQSFVFGLNLDFNTTITIGDLLRKLQAKLQGHSPHITVIGDSDIHNFNPPQPCQHILLGVNVNITRNLEIASSAANINPPRQNIVYIPFPFDNKFPWRN